VCPRQTLAIGGALVLGAVPVAAFKGLVWHTLKLCLTNIMSRNEDSDDPGICDVRAAPTQAWIAIQGTAIHPGMRLLCTDVKIILEFAFRIALITVAGLALVSIFVLLRT